MISRRPPAAAWLLAAVGPVVALAVTWGSSLRVAGIDGGEPPAGAVVERLRSVPGDEVLRALEETAVGTTALGDFRGRELVAADRLLDGTLEVAGRRYAARAPVDPGSPELDSLAVCSFAIPSLLLDAYDLARDDTYLAAAVDYVQDWSELEESLLVPRGLVFNDHATAARAVVVTALWQRYRNSAAYDAGTARRLLAYAGKLAELLLYPSLYEYRSNHGIMQNLALLHLGIGLPLLDTSAAAVATGRRRLLAQLEYYVNAEGVILEHSSSYHHNGLVRLAAAWRYLGLLGEPVPAELRERYRKALAFRRALLRPDATLPPVGDTRPTTHAGLRVAALDERSVAVAIEQGDERPESPPRLTLAPGAGWLILWNGIEQWPHADALSQTVVHWGNFPSGAHKHADDLGLSIWSQGVQWARGAGYWPYGRSRGAATGWRGSNAPHWLDEPPGVSRSARLEAMAASDGAAFFQFARANDDGAVVRRQLLHWQEAGWFVVDSFKAPDPRTAEIVWRFPPSVTLRRADAMTFELAAPEAGRSALLAVLASGPARVDADAAGEASWNAGIATGDGIAAAPAVRVTSSARRPALLAIFSHRPELAAASWRFDDGSVWRIALPDGRTIERNGATLELLGGSSGPLRLALDDSVAEAGVPAARAARAAYDRAVREWGTPYQRHAARRAKATAAIAFATAAQLLLAAVVARTRRRWLAPLGLASGAGWVLLSGLLAFTYLG